jgi:hypothetical protein
MAARIRKQHQDETRARIQTTQLINRLQKQADGEVELTPMQMKAIEILLRKALPDLSAVELSGEVTNRTAREIPTDDQLADIATGSGAGATDEAQGPSEPPGLH